MISFDQYLTERNIILTTYKKFVVSYMDNKHFTQRLKERAGIGLSKFTKRRVPQICKKIEENGLEPGRYAFVFTKAKFIVIAKFTPNKTKNSHDLFLITCLASSMTEKNLDHKIIVEYFVKLFDVDLSLNEAVVEETDEFENDFFVFTKEDEEIKLDTATNLHILEIDK